MRTVGVLAIVGGILAGCSSSSEGEGSAFTCSLGELRGTWRLSYQEQAGGTCGPIADETVVLTDKTSSSGACQENAAVVSGDKCRMDLDFTCPTPTGAQRWVGATRQVAEDRLIGDMTVQATDGSQGCRSTYTITWQRQ